MYSKMINRIPVTIVMVVVIIIPAAFGGGV
jgi:hypothetical protein